MKNKFNKQEYYRAHLARDARFDGQFFVAVKSTMIYCRPICPARKAQLKNLDFYTHAAQAEEAGYRPCMRCRPDAAPGSTAWLGTSAIVQRAIKLMDYFGAEDVSVKNIALKLNVGERWLGELFQREVGANCLSILIARRLDVARNLLDHSSLSITDIAFSSGFQSIRRFNDAFKKRFKKTPSEFRKASGAADAQTLQLAFRPPYHWQAILDFFAYRAIPECEIVEENSYQRLIKQGDVKGWFKATLTESNKINMEFKFSKYVNMMAFVACLKNMFDLDADPMAIESVLNEDKKLKPYMEQYKGLRVPGGWGGFEIAIRAVIGQVISVKAARKILSNLVQVCGEKQNLDSHLALTYFFPTPKEVINANLDNVGLTNAKIATIKSLAVAIENKELALDGSEDVENTREALLSIKGIGPWTAEYIAMRALGDPNAFPETDLELIKKIKRLKLDPKKWMPWRAYAAVLLWGLE